MREEIQGQIDEFKAMNLIDRIKVKKIIVNDNNPSITAICDIAYNKAIDDILDMSEIQALSAVWDTISCGKHHK